MENAAEWEPCGRISPGSQPFGTRPLECQERRAETRRIAPAPATRGGPHETRSRVGSRDRGTDQESRTRSCKPAARLQNPPNLGQGPLVIGNQHEAVP